MQTDCISTTIATITPLSTWRYKSFVFEIHRISVGRYYYKVFGETGFIYDSGGEFPKHYVSVMEATHASQSWLLWQQSRGAIE